MADKVPADVFYNQGSSKVYDVINRGSFRHAPSLRLYENVRYKFQLIESPSSQPLIITTSSVGGPASTPYVAGVENSFAFNNEALYFTPSSSTPRTLYYQSLNEELVGGTITVLKPIAINAESCPASFTTPAPTTAAPTSTVALASFIVDASGTQGANPMRYSTAFSVDARLFTSSHATSSAATTACQQACSADVNCEGFVILIGSSSTSCVGLSDIGTLVPTHTTSQSVRKL